MAHSASAGLLMFQGSLANLAKCTLRGDCLGVDEAMHDGWFTAFQGALYCSCKFISLGDPFAVPTKCLVIGCKIRVLQLRSLRSIWIVDFLVHTDGAVHFIINKNNQYR